jgi:1-aminocyclopropane-1-carboxylate deaminase/D-cysteine desulfhydrase-like pyridoxal-dependent ACC family enzyme
MLLHVAALLLPFTQCLYLILAATSLYVPIMGRSGAGTNAEIIVGLLIGTKFGLLLTCIVSINTNVLKKSFLTLVTSEAKTEDQGLDNVLMVISTCK